jgi:membrane protein
MVDHCWPMIFMAVAHGVDNRVCFYATIELLWKGGIMRFDEIKFMLKETVLKWNADNCLRLGASVSYYAIFSLFPLILVVLTIIRLLLESSTATAAHDTILDALASMTGGFRTEFANALEITRRTPIASGIVGPVALILGASWVFGELVSAFNIIWDVEAPAEGGPLHFIHTTFFSFALVFAGAFLLLISMIISALLTALGAFITTLPEGFVLWQVVHILINLCVLTGVFALLLKYLPMTYVAWGDVWLGAALTAILWSVLQLVISYYITLSGYEKYGAIGAIMALIVWVYISSQVLFLGGIFTNIYAHHYGSRAGTPVVIPSPRESVVQMPVSSEGAVQTPPSAVEQTTPPSTMGVRLTSGMTGLVLGVLGTIGMAVIALLISIQRAARRLRP